MRTACVGEIRFIVSEPAAQTMTANSLPTPRNSPNEPIMGMVAVANPDDDGIKKTKICIQYMQELGIQLC